MLWPELPSTLKLYFCDVWDENLHILAEFRWFSRTLRHWSFAQHQKIDKNGKKEVARWRRVEISYLISFLDDKRFFFSNSQHTHSIFKQIKFYSHQIVLVFISRIRTRSSNEQKKMGKVKLICFKWFSQRKKNGMKIDFIVFHGLERVLCETWKFS